MPSIRTICGVVVAGLAVGVSSLPAQPKLNSRAKELYEKHALVTRQSGGLSDVDILQFALTAENLESTFYRTGFAMFPDSDFEALGLNQNQITDLKSIGVTEDEHVTTLDSAIAATGIQPVAPCNYNFGFIDAKSMIATAAVLENVGVSAYLGAAPLVSDKTILGIAAQIVTVESRHQTFIRTAAQSAAVPSPFDTPLSAKSVFTIAAQFIKSCPNGSNLNIKPFPPVQMAGMAAGSMMSNVQAGQNLAVSGGDNPKFCAFINGGIAGGTAFMQLTDGGCPVPQNLKGIGYLALTSSAPAGLVGAISDDIQVAGPMPMQFS